MDVRGGKFLSPMVVAQPERCECGSMGSCLSCCIRRASWMKKAGFWPEVERWREVSSGDAMWVVGPAVFMNPHVYWVGSNAPSH